MLDLIPPFLELETDIGGYERLARSVREAASLTPEERQSLLDFANTFFTKGTISGIAKVVGDIAGDREFYRLMGMDYARGEEEGLFTVGVVYHLLIRGFIQNGN